MTYCPVLRKKILLCYRNNLKLSIMKKVILFGLVALMASMTSCKKDSDENTDTDQTPKTAQTYTPSYQGEYMLFVAVRTKTTTSTPVGDMDVNVPTAVALYSTDGGSNFEDMGDVSINGYEMKQVEGSKVYNYIAATPGATDDLKLDGSNPQTKWVYSGTSSVAGHTFDYSNDFPAVGKVTAENPKTSSDYTVSIASIERADSVLFGLYGSNDAIFKVVKGDTKTYTFTAAEVEKAGKGSAMVQVTGIKYYQAPNDAPKTTYFVNEEVVTKMVTIE